MNWIAARFDALVAKVETALTSHSALEKRVEVLEALLAEPKAEPAPAPAPAPVPAPAELNPAQLAQLAGLVGGG